MKVIIAGGRSMDDYVMLCLGVKKCHFDITEVVSGTARGADRMGEIWAERNNVPVTRFPADWETKGRGAGHIRNAEMADYADALLVFWDGESKGTASMIKLAQKHDLPIHLEYFSF